VCERLQHKRKHKRRGKGGINEDLKERTSKALPSVAHPPEEDLLSRGEAYGYQRN
jgi:hypothetical protein